MVIKTTRKQIGEIIGTLLASVSALIILNKLLSGGLRNRRSGRGLINRTPTILQGYFPPVHLGRGSKRRTGGVRKKQPFQEHSSTREHIVTFKNKLISNYDILRRL